MKKNMISFVVPAFNENDSLPELISIIDSVSKKSSVENEIIVVDDGSTDATKSTLIELSKKYTQLKYFGLRINYGKAAALSVGFQAASGEFIATLDADLQDDPNEVPPMIAHLKENNLDMVSGWKKKRHDPISKTVPSKFFNFVTSKVSGLKLHDYNCGIKVYKSIVAKNISIYGELHRYIPVLAHWLGFKVGEKEVVHKPRKYGKSKYGFARFINGFLDLLTVLFINRYTKKPLHLFGAFGILFLLCGMAINGYFLVAWIVEGSMRIRPLLMFGNFAIILAIQFFSIGLIGELIVHSSKEKEYKIAYKIGEDN